MQENTKKIAASLKELIDKNGPSYLFDKPYDVYLELTKEEKENQKIAASLLHLFALTKKEDLTKKIGEDDFTKFIQTECSLNKKMADLLREILLSLYSKDNQSEWKKNEQSGYNEFLNEDFIIHWNGFATWNPGEGTRDCKYEAEITLTPTKEIKKNKNLSIMLKKNPFLTKKEIHDFFEETLIATLDEDFEEYCTSDDYYEPCVEDYDLKYTIEEWCKKNGFIYKSEECINCELGDYEPRYRRGWY